MDISSIEELNEDEIINLFAEVEQEGQYISPCTVHCASGTWYASGDDLHYSYRYGPTIHTGARYYTCYEVTNRYSHSWGSFTCACGYRWDGSGCIQWCHKTYGDRATLSYAFYQCR